MGSGKEVQAAFPLVGNRCALRPFQENRNYTAISPFGKGIRRVTSANKERRLRTSRHKPHARKSRNAVCAAASEYRNAAFSSHEDKDRAGPKRESLHCAVRFRVEQHRPPPSESVHDSFISYSDGRRHRWSHNPFCVNRHDIFQNSTAEQRQFTNTITAPRFLRQTTQSRRFDRNVDGVMKPRARRSCTQATRRADAATR